MYIETCSTCCMSLYMSVVFECQTWWGRVRRAHQQLWCSIGQPCYKRCSGLMFSTWLALFEGNPLVTSGFPLQRTNNAEFVSQKNTGKQSSWWSLDMLWFSCDIRYPLRWRHNGHDSVSNLQPHHCLLNPLFRRRSKKTSKLRVTGLCVGNSPGTGEFPAQMASNAENVSIWWRHHVDMVALDIGGEPCRERTMASYISHDSILTPQGVALNNTSRRHSQPQRGLFCTKSY